METTHYPSKASLLMNRASEKLSIALRHVAFAVGWKLYELFVFRPAYAMYNAECDVIHHRCAYQHYEYSDQDRVNFVWDAWAFRRGWIQGFFSPQVEICSSFTAERLGHPGLVKLYPHVGRPENPQDPETWYLDCPRTLVLRDLSGRFECRVAHSLAWTPRSLTRALDTPIAQAFCKFHFGANAYLGDVEVGSTEV